ALTSAGQLDRTLVVVAADHGESLGEHGERTHGVFAYDATLRVPWLVWAGRRITPRAFDEPARLIDLAPTLLDLAGIRPPDTFDGRSMLPALNANGPRSVRVQADAADGGGRIAYFEAMDANLTRNWAPLSGLVSGHYKLIELPGPELYDLAADPGETTNLFTREGERARTLEALLRDERAQLASRTSAA